VNSNNIFSVIKVCFKPANSALLLHVSSDKALPQNRCGLPSVVLLVHTIHM